MSEDAAAAAAGRTLARHALAWLQVGNLSGLALAAWLLWPESQALFGAVTFGRVAPVHLGAVLYGWCGLAVVGILLRLFEVEPRGERLAVGGWSVALLSGVVSWLRGGSSGELFLDWRGLPLAVWTGAQVLLALVLGRALRDLARRADRPASRKAALGGLWVALLAAPAVFWRAAAPDTYPPIDPSTGGPTGASLLLSSLALLPLWAAVPRAFGLPASARLAGRAGGGAAWAWGLHAGGACLLLAAGDAPHRDPRQWLALASLFLWAPALWRDARSFDWPAASWVWVRALAAWSLAVLVGAWITFLPGVLDAVKFTSVLVAHAHAAMAGIASCVALLVVQLGLWHGGERDAAGALGRRATVWTWNLGLLAMVASLTALGSVEANAPGVVFYAAAPSTAVYTLRAAAGVAMGVAAASWLRALERRPGPAPAPAWSRGA